jgi:hypothetical protein
MLSAVSPRTPDRLIRTVTAERALVSTSAPS